MSQWRPLRLWPDDVPVEDFDAAEFFGVKHLLVATPHGSARVYYLLFRIPGSDIHAELTEWSLRDCTVEQVDWMVDHQLEFRHAMRLHLEQVLPGMPPRG